jgi:N-acetylglucosaminyldiphosphoundecaprenol N-acetyl-beta-D-mannosaminyltransferase
MLTGVEIGEMEKRRMIGIDLSSGSYTEFIERIVDLGKTRTSSYVCLVNAHMTIEAYWDKRFSEVVNGADVEAPDGMPLVRAFKLIHGIRQDRVAGMDLMLDLLREAERQGLSIYLHGSTPEVLEKITERIKREYPALTIAGVCSPPFTPPTEEEERAAVERINDSGANIVLVALGCPKQENWMARNKGKINAVMVGVGGVFPIYAGIQGRAPKWMRDHCLEWVYRLCSEPRRLFKRYLVSNTVFLWLLVREIVSKGFSRR